MAELASRPLRNDTSLTAYWGLDGSSNDEKGSNNGSDTAITYASGRFDRCAQFNGSTSKVTLALITAATTNISFGGWIYWLDSSAARGIFYNGSSGANGYGMYINDGAGNPGSQLGLLCGNVSINGLTSAPTLPSQVWTHVFITRDATTWTLYINGVALATGTTNPIAPGTSSVMGTDNTVNNGFNGYLDDWCFFTRQLTATEVNCMYLERSNSFVGRHVSVGTGMSRSEYAS